MTNITYRGAVYQLRSDETALDALVRGGADVAFSCRKGSCQTCLMRSVSGEPGAHAQRGLRDELIATRHFMPCICKPEQDLELVEPDLSQLLINSLVSQVRRIGERILRISLETETALNCKPGQYINVHGKGGLVRSYSVRGIIQEDYFLEFDVQLVPGGAMSEWFEHELKEGDWIQVQGPLGECHYRAEDQARSLILIGTGSGVAPLHGIVRDALRAGHQGGIWLYYGARDSEQLYAHPELEPLAERGVNYRAVVLNGEPPEGHFKGDVVAKAFSEHPDAEEAILFLCGDANLVQYARCEAVLAGAKRAHIRADPFESNQPESPKDQTIIRGIQADPELWAALDEGPKLRAILEDFYTEVYQDSRLSPFFHNVTKERAVSKQYEFLVDMFKGSRTFFGLKPFNAHHWMVISDDLFDYREAMFERHLRSHQVSEAHIRRWAYLHELFRREIVKSRARGLFVDGVEHLQEGFQEEKITFATMCDGCSAEMQLGTIGRLHRRTGQLYCEACGARNA